MGWDRMAGFVDLCLETGWMGFGFGIGGLLEEVAG